MTDKAPCTVGPHVQTKPQGKLGPLANLHCPLTNFRNLLLFGSNTSNELLLKMPQARRCSVLTILERLPVVLHPVIANDKMTFWNGSEKRRRTRMVESKKKSKLISLPILVVFESVKDDSWRQRIDSSDPLDRDIVRP